MYSIFHFPLSSPLIYYYNDFSSLALRIKMNHNRMIKWKFTFERTRGWLNSILGLPGGEGSSNTTLLPLRRINSVWQSILAADEMKSTSEDKDEGRQSPIGYSRRVPRGSRIPPNTTTQIMRKNWVTCEWESSSTRRDSARHIKRRIVRQ